MSDAQKIESRITSIDREIAMIDEEMKSEIQDLKQRYASAKKGRTTERKKLIRQARQTNLQRFLQSQLEGLIEKWQVEAERPKSGMDLIMAATAFFGPHDILCLGGVVEVELPGFGKQEAHLEARWIEYKKPTYTVGLFSTGAPKGPAKEEGKARMTVKIEAKPENYAQSGRYYYKWVLNTSFEFDPVDGKDQGLKLLKAWLADVQSGKLPRISDMTQVDVRADY